MEDKIKILIVEDELLLAADLSMHLESLGYDVLDMLTTGEEALDFIQTQELDMMLVDIQLDGGMSGIEMVAQASELKSIPVIYLTSNTDDATFALAKETNPQAFLSKPFNKLDLQRAIELAAERLYDQSNDNSISAGRFVPFVLTDSLFVKHTDSMVKVVIHNMLYIEAERSYCRIHTKEKEFLLSMPLKEMEEKLPGQHFLRVHRSFIVNLSHIDEVSNTHVQVAGKSVPITKEKKVDLMKRLQTL